MNRVARKKYKIGYNRRLDLSLAARHGAKNTKKTNYKSRRAGARNLEKYWRNRRAFNVNTMIWKKRVLRAQKQKKAVKKAAKKAIKGRKTNKRRFVNRRPRVLGTFSGQSITIRPMF